MISSNNWRYLQLFEFMLIWHSIKVTFVTTKLNFVMTIFNFVDKIHFCRQKSLLSLQNSLFNFVDKIHFCHDKIQFTVVVTKFTFVVTKLTFVNKIHFSLLLTSSNSFSHLYVSWSLIGWNICMERETHNKNQLSLEYTRKYYSYVMVYMPFKNTS
jgi:hypothetical protein